MIRLEKTRLLYVMFTSNPSPTVMAPFSKIFFVFLGLFCLYRKLQSKSMYFKETQK